MRIRYKVDIPQKMIEAPASTQNRVSLSRRSKECSQLHDPSAFSEYPSKEEGNTLTTQGQRVRYNPHLAMRYTPTA